MIGGEEHCVFFSLGVIDELQSRFGKTVGQLLVMLKDPVEGPGYLREILTALLNDEGIRLKNGKRYRKEEVGSLVMQSEDEIFNMTPKKFFTLFEKYLELNGKKKDTRAAIDMLP